MSELSEAYDEIIRAKFEEEYRAISLKAHCCKGPCKEIFNRGILLGIEIKELLSSKKTMG